MNTLQQQIEQLTADYNFKEYAKGLFPNTKILAFVSNGNKRIVVTASTLAEARYALNVLPATNKTTELRYAGKDSTVVESPYRIDLNNPPVTNSSQYFHYEISYQSNDIDVQIDITANQLADFISTTKRHITDSEYHYFTGYSHTELSKTQVMRMVFNSSSVVNWYGGNQTLTDEYMIQQIIDSIQ